MPGPLKYLRNITFDTGPSSLGRTTEKDVRAKPAEIAGCPQEVLEFIGIPGRIADDHFCGQLRHFVGKKVADDRMTIPR